MKILVISAVARRPEEHLPLGALARAASPGATLEKVYLDHGPACIEGELDRALVAPGVVVRACEGEQRGVDAVMIYCAADPGLREARQAVHIPVVGAGQRLRQTALPATPDLRRLRRPGIRGGGPAPPREIADLDRHPCGAAGI